MRCQLFLLLVTLSWTSIAQEKFYSIQLVPRPSQQTALLNIGQQTYHVDLSRPFLVESATANSPTHVVHVPLVPSEHTGEHSGELKNYKRLTLARSDFDRLTVLKSAMKGRSAKLAKFRALKNGAKSALEEKTITADTRFRLQDIQYVSEEGTQAQAAVSYTVQVGNVQNDQADRKQYQTPHEAKVVPAAVPLIFPAQKLPTDETRDIFWEDGLFEIDHNFVQLIEEEDLFKLTYLQNHLVGAQAVDAMEKSFKAITPPEVGQDQGCPGPQEQSAPLNAAFIADGPAVRPSPTATLTSIATPTERVGDRIPAAPALITATPTVHSAKAKAHFSEAIVECTLQNMGVRPIALSLRNARYLAPLLSQKMEEAGITGRREKIHFLSQMLHETQGLKYFSEKGDDAQNSGCWSELNSDPLSDEESLCDSYLACCESDNTNKYFARRSRPYRSEFRGRGVFHLTRCDNYFAFLNFLRFERARPEERAKLQRFRNHYHTTANQNTTKNQVGHFCTPEQINAVKGVEPGIDPWNLMNGLIDDKQLGKEERAQNRLLRQQALNRISVPCDRFTVPAEVEGVPALSPAEFITASAVYFWQANLARERKEFSKSTIDDDLKRPLNRKNMIYKVTKIVNGGARTTKERANYVRALNNCIPR